MTTNQERLDTIRRHLDALELSIMPTPYVIDLAHILADALKDQPHLERIAGEIIRVLSRETDQ